MPTFLAFEVPLAADGRLQVRTLGDGLLHDVANEPNVDPPGGGIRVRLVSGFAAVVPSFLSIATPDPVAVASVAPAALKGPQYPGVAVAATAVPAAQVFIGGLHFTPAATAAATAVPSASIVFAGTTVLTPSPVALRSNVPAAVAGVGAIVLYPDPTVSSSFVPLQMVPPKGAPFEIPAAPDGFAYVRLLDLSTQEVANYPNLPAPGGDLLIRDVAGNPQTVPLWLATATPDPGAAASRVPHATLVFGVPVTFLTPAPTAVGAAVPAASVNLGTLFLAPQPGVDGARAFVAHLAQGAASITLFPDAVALTSSALAASVSSAGTLVLTPQACAAAAGVGTAAVNTGTLFLLPPATAARSTVPHAQAVLGDIFAGPDATACGTAVPTVGVLFERFLTPDPVADGASPLTVNQVAKAKVHGIPDAIAVHCVVPAVQVVISGPLTVHPDAVASSTAVPDVHAFQWTTGGPVIVTKTRAPGQAHLGS